ncbi:unnamed protein product [Closterium sp. NIES-53]
MLQKWLPKDEQIDAAENAARKSKAQKGAGAGKSGAQEGSEKLLQLPCRAEMVHYLDVRDGGWDLKECECCFDRAVSYRTQRALNMMRLEDFRSQLHKQMPDSVPAAPPNRPTCTILDHSARNSVWAVGDPRRAPPPVHYHWKCEHAPYFCAEGMLVEWFAEPRVGVLMDLGKIRSKIPAILNAAGVPSSSPSPSLSSPKAAADHANAGIPDAAAASSCSSSGCRCSNCWAAFRRAVSFATFLVLVARSPRIVTIWRAHMDSHSAAFPAMAAALGAGWQAEQDSFASALVQILGLKERGDLKEGFGFFLQEILSGGLEKSHAEGKGRGAGGGAGGSGAGRDAAQAQGGRGVEGMGMQEIMRAMVRLMEREGGMGPEERRRLMGDPGMIPMDAMMKMLWDKDAMRWLTQMLEAESGGNGGGGPEAEGSEGEGADGGDDGGEGKDGDWREKLKGRAWERYVDGMAWKLEHGEGEGREFSCSHCNGNRSRSSSRSSSGSSGGGGGSSSGGSTALANLPKGMYVSGVGATEFALAVASVLSQPEHSREVQTFLLDCNNASKTRVEEAAIEAARTKVGGERRLAGVEGEMGEGGGGDGAAPKLMQRWVLPLLLLLLKVPVLVLSVPMLLLWAVLVIQAGSKGWGERGEREEKGGGARGGRGGGRGNGRGRDPGEGPMSLMDALLGATAPQNRTVPIVRCTADAEFLVEFAGNLVDPPECSQCNNLSPAHCGIRRVVRPAADGASSYGCASAAEPACGEEESGAASCVFSPPGGDSFAEIDAADRGKPQNGKKGGKKRGVDGEEEGEDDGKVWEEVRAWALAAMYAWKATLRMIGPGLGETCKGSKVRKGKGSRWDGGKWVAGMWQRAVEPRYRKDQEEQDGQTSSSNSSSSLTSSCSGSGSGSGSSSSSSSSEGTGKKGEVPAYLKPWPGGVNLLACLREMLLGEPCYRLAPPAASSSTPAASSSAPSAVTMAAAANTTASNSAATATAAAVVATAAVSEASGVRVCSAEGCGKVEGGGVMLKGCSGCGKVAYCNRDCQKAHWPAHKLTCQKKSGGKV